MRLVSRLFAIVLLQPIWAPELLAEQQSLPALDPEGQGTLYSKSTQGSEAGSNVVELSDSVGGFGAWTVLASLPADRRGPLDTNGPLRLPNLLSYGMAIDPGLATVADLPSLDSSNFSAGTATFRYRRSKALEDVFLRAQLSEDQVSWTNADFSDLQVISTSSTHDLVELTRTIPVHGRLFFRLKADTRTVLDGMVLVEGGTLATSNPLNGTMVSNFYIGRYEVAWGKWKEVRSWATDNGYDISGVGAGCADDHPVHSISWLDALKWCNARSEMEGLRAVYASNAEVFRSGQPLHTSISQDLSANGYRLPMEAEWEYAARGGNQTKGTTFAGSSDPLVSGWFLNNSGGAECALDAMRGTWPVGQKVPNEIGLHDMSGNVFEWCWDPSPEDGYRHARGGSWNYGSTSYTVSDRVSFDANDRTGRQGLRIARSTETTSGTRLIELVGNLAFDPVTVAESATRTFTIVNTGTSTLTVTGITFPVGFSGSWSGGTIEPGTGRNVNVTFAPTATQAYGGSVTVASDATGGISTLAITGMGAAVGTRLIGLDGDLAFGSVYLGQTVTRTLSISNTGTATLVVTGISFPAGFSGNWSGGPIEPETSRFITVTFAPTAPQVYGGTLTIASDATGGSNTLSISGTGLELLRRIELNGNLSFGSVPVGQSASRMLTISNTGNGALTVSSVKYTAGFTVNWSRGTIAPGGSHDIIVTFTPVAVQTYNDYIVFNSDANSGLNFAQVSGTGISRIIGMSSGITFPGVLVGSSASQEIAIYNTGTATLTVFGISYPEGFSGNWSSGTVSPGGSRSVMVTFSPTAAKVYSGNFTVNSDATSGTSTRTLSGTGIAITRIIGFVESLTFGSVPVGGSTRRTLTITNKGNSTLTVASLSYPEGFSGNWSGGTIAPNRSRELSVTFAPTAERDYSGVLTVVSDATNDLPSLPIGGLGTSDAPSSEHFAYIPPGTFMQGSPDSELGRGSDENQRQTTLTRGFFLSRTETTKAQWDAVKFTGGFGYTDLPEGWNGNQTQEPSATQPVTGVSWWDAVKWLNKRSELEGRRPVYYQDSNLTSVLRSGSAGTVYVDWSANGYRLPTEAEWEYACRAGTTTAFYTGGITLTSLTSRDPNLDLAGWFYGNSSGGTRPIGTKQANSFGLFDMHGNVSEWCWDWVGSYDGMALNPTGPSSGSSKIRRGGSWQSNPAGCRSAERAQNFPGGSYSTVGFRAALMLPP